MIRGGSTHFRLSLTAVGWNKLGIDRHLIPDKASCYDDLWLLVISFLFVGPQSTDKMHDTWIEAQHIVDFTAATIECLLVDPINRRMVCRMELQTAIFKDIGSTDLHTLKEVCIFSVISQKRCTIET